MIRHSRIRSPEGEFFQKTGDSDDVRLLTAEALGLRALAAAKTSLSVPAVIRLETGRVRDKSSEVSLVTEWFEQTTSAAVRVKAERALAAGLAQLHLSTGPAFGFHADNFIGLGSQPNPYSDRWDTFFAEARLLPMIEAARHSGIWRASWERWTSSLLNRIPDLLPSSPMISLVHGDLWKGNFLALEDGRAGVIDPAVYYGHREVDIAMTELFGGFGDGFYAHYDELLPLDAGYGERRPVYNLYHLLNHLNIFGSSYAEAVERTLRTLGR